MRRNPRNPTPTARHHHHSSNSTNHMYRHPMSSNNLPLSSHHHHHNNPNPIQTFAATISRIPSDEWRAKTAALEQLVDSISAALSASVDDADDDDTTTQHSFDDCAQSLSSLSRDSSYRSKLSNASWNRRSNHHRHGFGATAQHHSSRALSSHSYSSPLSPPPSPEKQPQPPKSERSIVFQPNALRQLAIPFRSLLTDLRTLVIKSTCHHLALISELTTDRAKHLMKDLLPDMLSLHQQTAKVVHGYAMGAMLTILQCTRFKSGLKVLVKEGRGNKSKDVRVACIRYIRQVIDCWPPQYLSKESESLGKALAKGLMDPCQNVRMESRNAFLRSYYRQYPDLWYKIVHDPTGILSRDIRMKRSIMLQANALDKQGENGVSATSASAIHPAPKGEIQPVPNPFASVKVLGAGSGTSTPTIENKSVASSILRRKNNPDSVSVKILFESESRHKAASSIQAAIRGAAVRHSVFRLPKSPSKARLGTTAKDMAIRRTTLPRSEVLPLPPTPDCHKLSFGKTEASPPVPLQMTTSPSEGRCSSLSPSSLTEHQTQQGNDQHEQQTPPPSNNPQHTPPNPSPSPLLTPLPPLRRESSLKLLNTLQQNPEHVQISQKLLKAHKRHIDRIMQILQEEMTLFSDFEALLQKHYRSQHNLEVEKMLEYFEGMEVCLKDRMECGEEMGRVMDGIAKGESLS